MCYRRIIIFLALLMSIAGTGFLILPEVIDRIEALPQKSRDASNERALRPNHGIRVYGMVLRPDLTPAPWAKVLLGPMNWRWKWNVDASEDGLYTILIDGPGTYELAAYRFGVGIMPPVLIEVGQVEEFEAPPLHLGEYESIEGHVKVPTGFGLEGVFVKAYPAALMEADNLALSDYLEKTKKGMYRDSVFEEGMTYGHTFSYENGRFRIAGLRRGLYFCHSESLGIASFWNPLNNMEPYPRTLCETGERNVDLTVDLHILELHVKDEAGSPIEHASLRYSFPIRGEGGEFLKMSAPIEDAVHGGKTLFPVAPGPVHITAHTKSRRWCETELIIEEGAYHTKAELVLPQPGEHGRIALGIIMPEGEDALQPKDLVFRICGSIKETSYRKMNGADLDRNEEGDFILHLPPDSYGIDVNPRNRAAYLMNKILRGIKVESGRTTRVEVPLVKGGQIDILLRTFEEPERHRMSRVVMENGRHVTVFNAHIWKLDKPKDSKGTDASSEALHEEAQYTYTVSRRLAPGEYILKVKSANGEPLSVDFKIIPGEITSLNLDF